MDEAQFLRGRHNPKEGGPEGLDIRSITAEARAKVAPLVKSVLYPPRRVTSPERRKS
jgi:hypothetical protein